MFQSITFYVGEKTLGIYGEEFPLGTLTTEVLNITPEEYQALDGSLKSAIEGMALYLWRVRICFGNRIRFPSPVVLPDAQAL